MDEDKIHIRGMVQFFSTQFAHSQNHERRFREMDPVFFLEYFMDCFQSNLKQAFSNGSPFLKGLDKSFRKAEITDADSQELSILPASEDIFQALWSFRIHTANLFPEFL